MCVMDEGVNINNMPQGECRASSPEVIDTVLVQAEAVGTIWPVNQELDVLTNT